MSPTPVVKLCVHFGIDFSAILTHVPISSSEFDIYRLGEECDLTFCLKDFRAAVAFGESMNSIVSVHCSRPGKPLVLTCTDNNRFKAHFVLASLPSAHTPKQPPVHPISNTSSHFKSMNTVSATPSSSRVKKSNLQSSDTALMAPTQVLQSSETGIARTHFEATTPLSVNCENPPEPAIKKARSVLFSRSGGEDAEDTFFRNPPPAQPAVPLCEDLFENVDMDVSFSAAQCDTDARSNCRPSSTRLIDAKAAATSGWDNADSLRALAVADADCGRKSNATLLVADSDEEG
uniref:Cell cycle checkpoint control protein n=1 Tax=Mesocestoides corti TaxID=53468 RepID=A0A5K3EN18_MESCO